MKIAIATDHRGEILKEKIFNELKDTYEFIDLSPINESNDDFTDFAFKVGNIVANREVDFGILICGSGIGMSIAANKVKGIRCALVKNITDAKGARTDDDANIIALGTTDDVNDSIEFIKEFLNTSLDESPRRIRRLAKITSYEQGEYYEF